MTIFTASAASTPADLDAYVAGLLRLSGDRDPVATLGQTTDALRAFLEGVPAGIVQTPEAPGKWSIAEVFQHLADAELVGAFRLRMIMAHDRPALMAYDQDLWATRLGYRDTDVNEALAQFAALRHANLRIWQRLGPADLARVGLHSERGEESLEHMRRLYAGHDLLHLRQLDRVRSAVS